PGTSPQGRRGDVKMGILADKIRSQPMIASGAISPVFGRRGFLSSALGGAAYLATSAEPARASLAGVQTRALSPALGPLKRVRTSLLETAYADVGPPEGQAVLLLHGWPYDIHTYADVAPLLAAAGFRVIIPYLRGYGATRFRSDASARNGQQA